MHTYLQYSSCHGKAELSRTCNTDLGKDAIRREVDIASDAIEGKRWRFGTKEYCAFVTLDIKNALGVDYERPL